MSRSKLVIFILIALAVLVCGTALFVPWPLGGKEVVAFLRVHREQGSILPADGMTKANTDRAYEVYKRTQADLSELRLQRQFVVGRSPKM